MSRLGKMIDRLLGRPVSRAPKARGVEKSDSANGDGDGNSGDARASRRERRAREAERWTGDKLYCPVCRRTAAEFSVYGKRRRPNARCPWCGSMERHRFACLLLERKTNLFKPSGKGGGLRMLHFAPEPALGKRMQEGAGAGYLTADLMAPDVHLRLDLTAIGLAEGSVDAIYCSHVLEHVTEDRLAMREMRRVLKPGGWVLISVPVMAERTIEDPTVTDPAERERLFNQADHVRIYGPDIKDRMIEAGFDVEVCWPRDIATEAERERMALTRACGEIFLATKPLASN